MKQEELRKKVRILKATQDISYKELAEMIELRDSSMYNWLRNQYDLSYEKAKLLADIVALLTV